MFSPEKGKELIEEEVLCPENGASSLPEEVVENLEDIQISFDEIEMEAEQAETVEEVTEEEAEEAVETEEETEEAEEVEEIEEEITTDMDADAIVAEFLTEAAAAQEAKAAEEEEAVQEEVAPKKKKSRKVLWAILIPVIIVVLLAAAAGGVYFLATQNYEQAAACVEAKEYDKALELYEKFSFYGDSQEKIDELKAYWEGDAAEATVTSFKNQKAAFDDIIKNIENYGSFLENAAAEYDKTEQANAGT